MRQKVAVYSIWGELFMPIMVVLIIIGYITYDFIDILGTSLGYTVIAIVGTLIFLIFSKQLKSFVVVSISESFFLKKKKAVRLNYLYPVIINLVFGTGTIIHFYLRSIYDKQLDGLFWEYGVGVVISIGMWIFMRRKWMVKICNAGLIIGSKFDPKLIQWKTINQFTKKNKHYELYIQPMLPIKKISIPRDRSAQTETLVNWLRIEGVQEIRN